MQEHEDTAPASARGGCVELFVPGRLCLFGEHSDWAGSFRWENRDIRPGKTIVVGTEQGLYARARPLAEPVLVVRTTTESGESFGPETFDLSDPEALVEAAQRGGFWSYVAGVAYKVATEFNVGGLELDNYRTTLPLKKGLSSSAAVCVLVARAFNRLYGLQMSTRGEMQYAYEGERLTPSRCGKMDQACAFGSVPVLMTYDGDVLHVTPVSLGAPLHLVLVDMRAAKDTVIILSKLQEAYPHAKSPEHRALQQLLGPINEDINCRAVEFLKSGDAAALGELMREAQQQFDSKAGPVCPEQLTAPALHRVLVHPPVQGLVWGAKGVGSQGDSRCY